MPRKKGVNIVFSDYDEAAGIIQDGNGDRFVEIKEFDINKMHPLGPDDLQWAVKICVVGKPGTGKTTIIEHLMLYKSWMCPVSQVFAGNENFNHFYSARTTPVTVYSELDLKAMEEFAKRQNIARQYLPNPWAFQILEDVTEDPSLLKKHPIPAYYRKGRHWAMIHVEGTHTPMDLAPGQRSLIDYVFILANAVINDREKLYLNYASGAIPSYADFCDLMDQLTEDHMALVIDNTSSSPLISERVFFFRADPSRVPLGFRMGAPEAWAFNDERMDPNFRESFI